MPPVTPKNQPLDPMWIVRYKSYMVKDGRLLNDDGEWPTRAKTAERARMNFLKITQRNDGIRYVIVGIVKKK